jgi:hypothetical protein
MGRARRGDAERVVQVVEQVGRVAPRGAGAAVDQRLDRMAAAGDAQADDAGVLGRLGVVGGVADHRGLGGGHPQLPHRGRDDVRRGLAPLHVACHRGLIHQLAPGDAGAFLDQLELLLLARRGDRRPQAAHSAGFDQLAGTGEGP